jgi:hypothetical protein
VEIGEYGVQKIRNFTLISKWGFLSVSLVQKLEPKNSIFMTFSRCRLPLLFELSFCFSDFQLYPLVPWHR